MKEAGVSYFKVVALYLSRGLIFTFFTLHPFSNIIKPPRPIPPTKFVRDFKP